MTNNRRFHRKKEGEGSSFVLFFVFYLVDYDLAAVDGRAISPVNAPSISVEGRCSILAERHERLGVFKDKSFRLYFFYKSGIVIE